MLAWSLFGFGYSYKNYFSSKIYTNLIIHREGILSLFCFTTTVLVIFKNILTFKNNKDYLYSGIKILITNLNQHYLLPHQQFFLIHTLKERE